MRSVPDQQIYPLHARLTTFWWEERDSFFCKKLAELFPGPVSWVGLEIETTNHYVANLKVFSEVGENLNPFFLFMFHRIESVLQRWAQIIVRPRCRDNPSSFYFTPLSAHVRLHHSLFAFVPDRLLDSPNQTANQRQVGDSGVILRTLASSIITIVEDMLSNLVFNRTSWQDHWEFHLRLSIFEPTLF